MVLEQNRIVMRHYGITINGEKNEYVRVVSNWLVVRLYDYHAGVVTLQYLES